MGEPGGPSGRSGGSRPRRGSLRLRITLAAIAIVGVTLVGASAVFAVVQRAVLEQGIRSSATADAERVLARLETGATPDAAVEVDSSVESGFVAVASASSGVVLATGGDPDSMRLYRESAPAVQSGTLVLGGQRYLVSSTDATDRSTPAPTVTITPPADDRGGRSGSDGASTGGASAVPDDSTSGSSGGSGRSSGGSGSSSGSSGSGSSGGSSGSTSGGSGSGGSGSSGGSSTGGGADDALSALTPGWLSSSGTAASSSAAGPSAAGSTAAGSGPAAQYLVLAARSTVAAEATERATVSTLAVLIPILLLVMAATTWFVVGRALRPVERMRREVAGITASQLSRRLPDPGGADEISRLASTLNDMLDRLDSAAAAQRRFVSDASHELRSPLAVMRQHAEVAKSYPESLPPGQLAETVLAEGDRLADLVSAMLLLARADEGALARTVHTVDLDDVVLAEASRLRATGRLVVDSSRVQAARLQGDAGLLSQVVRNLADNAARHAAGTVRLELLDDDGGSVRLAVEDDGSGIEPDERERVFERFVRLDEARARESGGSGLGLAIVRGIVAGHGGSVRVTSGELGGARFEVVLPRAAEPDAPVDAT